MANETPKKPIRRVPVPSVSKEAQVNKTIENSENRIGQNILLLIPLIILSGLFYVVIFQKDLLLFFSSSDTAIEKNLQIVVDSTTSENTDSSAYEEVDTFIGGTKETKNNKAIVYPAGSKYYLIAGTFIFYPYAEKFKNKMIAQGYEADIISTGDVRKFHRIYIGSSSNGDELRLKRDELRNSKGLDVWIYAE